jgi:hypothetical protein
MDVSNIEDVNSVPASNNPSSDISSTTSAGGLIKNSKGSALSNNKDRKFSTYGPTSEARSTGTGDRAALNAYTRLSRLDTNPAPFAVVDIECIQAPHSTGHPKPANSTGQIPIAISAA